MFRTVPLLRSGGVSRSLLSSLHAAKLPVHQHARSRLCTVSQRQHALSLARPMAPRTLALVRWQSDRPIDKVDKSREAKIAEKTLQPTPELVSSSSTVNPVLSGGGQQPTADDDVHMMSGIYHDLATIRDTFSLAEVPRQAYYMGLAGVLPYMATSLSTVYCAWEINHSVHTGSGFLMSERTAELLLHIIEPLQVGYGAVIISFLGAIHWGLEWAQFNGSKGYPRYMIGVVSTAIAWPTIMLPVEYALITQFLVFNFLYYTDSRATKRGWAPPWYAVYRFVLTFIVGSAIVLSLIGRGQISDRIGTLPGPADRIRQLRDNQLEDMAADEEKTRADFLGDEEGKDDDEEGEGEDGEGEGEGEDGEGEGESDGEDKK